MFCLVYNTQCVVSECTFHAEQRRLSTGIFESDELDPKTIHSQQVTKVGNVSYDVPDFVDTWTAHVIKKFYFGLTTIRVETTFENPNGKDVVKTLVIDHDYHGN